jgi:ribosomal protein S12 methylthiotransferase
VDTEVLAGIAAQRGYSLVSDPSDADVIVVNTCGFIADAREESVNALLEMGRHRTNGRCKKLVAAGCLSQRYALEVAREMPEIDCVIGTTAAKKFEGVLSTRGRVVEVSAPGHFLQGPDTPRFVESGAPSVYVKVADGCSRKCAFCAIPSIRGKARSRPIAQIVGEAVKLVDAGVVEINLVSQDTSAYGADLGDGADIVSLVHALDRVEGLRWVRVHYLYPDGVSDELLHAMGDLKKLVPYLDIPFQHAAAKMLKRMRRGHGPRTLTSLIKRARRIVPDIFLRTTVLVGHPGETAGDFEELLDFVKWARFDHLGVFRYSDEEGTPSFEKGPVVSRRDSYNRFRKVMKVQRVIARENSRRMMGKIVRVLVEDSADELGYVLEGRHPGQAPEVDGKTYLVSSDARVGDIVDARVVGHRDHDLVAEPI